MMQQRYARRCWDAGRTVHRGRQMLQFRLRTLLLAFLGASVLLSGIACKKETARRQRLAAEAIRRLGGDALYASGVEPRWWHSLGERLLGERVFDDVVAVSLPDGCGEDCLHYLQAFPGLRVLSLARTRITDDGLMRLQSLSGLLALDLDATSITDDGLGHLVELKSLVSLSLQSTSITDAGIRRLAGLKRLEILNIQDTMTTQVGVDYAIRLDCVKELYVTTRDQDDDIPRVVQNKKVTIYTRR